MIPTPPDPQKGKSENSGFVGFAPSDLDLKPCPFCEAGETSIGEGCHTDEQGDVPIYFGECGSCGAMGPSFEDSEPARDAWNRRPVLKGEGTEPTPPPPETFNAEDHECPFCHSVPSQYSPDVFGCPSLPKDCPLANGPFLPIERWPRRPALSNGTGAGLAFEPIEWQAILDAMDLTEHECAMVSNAHTRARPKVEAMIAGAALAPSPAPLDSLLKRLYDEAEAFHKRGFVETAKLLADLNYMVTNRLREAPAPAVAAPLEVREAAIELLRDIQWKGVRVGSNCPSCGGYETYGHTEKCKLAKVLAALVPVPTAPRPAPDTVDGLDLKARDYLYELTATLRGWMEADEFAMSRTHELLSKVGAYLTVSAPAALEQLRAKRATRGSEAGERPMVRPYIKTNPNHQNWGPPTEVQPPTVTDTREGQNGKA